MLLENPKYWYLVMREASSKRLWFYLKFMLRFFIQWVVGCGLGLYKQPFNDEGKFINYIWSKMWQEKILEGQFRDEIIMMGNELNRYHNFYGFFSCFMSITINKMQNWMNYLKITYLLLILFLFIWVLYMHLFTYNY